MPDSRVSASAFPHAARARFRTFSSLVSPTHFHEDPFNYLGNGRYGFAAASEYYFGMPLSSYTDEDAGNAALLAGITQSPRDYPPAPRDPRPPRRRNEILALMAPHRYITPDVPKGPQARA